MGRKKEMTEMSCNSKTLHNFHIGLIINEKAPNCAKQFAGKHSCVACKVFIGT